MSTGDVIARFKQPEYTGENRCVPCTVMNVAIAVLWSAGLAVLGVLVAAPLVGAVVGLGVFVLAVASIYLRGYLVPGTPEFTKRYFPPWLLRAFGKEPEAAGGLASVEGTSDGTDSDLEDLDPESTLVAAGALEECEDGDDLCLTDDFRSNWAAEIERVADDDVGRERLLDLLDAEDGEVTVKEFGAAFVVRLDGQRVGQWESEAAYVADLGAAELLAWRVDGWADTSVEAKSALLNGLRLFIEVCPACGAEPEFGTETVESCCASREVVAVSCPDCDARLFETSAV